MSLYSTDYDAWKEGYYDCEDEGGGLREEAINRIMDEQELDWDDAEEVFDNTMTTWEQDQMMKSIESDLFERSYT